MNLYIQRPIRVTATRLTERATICTLEGVECAEAGDWVITGILGERWPVANEIFTSKYRPVMECPGSFEKLPIKVVAEVLKQDVSIATKWGNQSGKAGDWLVKEMAEDHPHIVVASVFSESYELVDEPA